MRLLKKIFIYLVISLAGIALLLYFYATFQKPSYSGKQELPDLDSSVTAYFDEYGVPHIYGNSEEDVFRVLGYLHAKERLFQIELIRRATSGRLSEIFGSQTLEADKFFRMLGFSRRAEETAAAFMENTSPAWKRNVLAYIDGLNEYVEKKRRRFEFLLLNIPKEKFSVKDIYLVVDFMSFNFQMGFKTDPLMSRISHTWGKRYLEEIGVTGSTFISDSIDMSSVDSMMSVIESQLPIKLWTGSNAWAVSADRSKKGKALFGNDTHIGVQQPAVWYEAHIECPGFGFYGSFIPGFPFPVMGHSRHHAWGLTILENDDLDFFAERIDTSDTACVYIDGNFEEIKRHREIIRVKDSADIILEFRSTSHGPVCSDVITDFATVSQKPVSLSWTYLKFPNNLPEVTWKMSHAESMNEFRDAISQIAAPGLNVIYADSSDNIAWYTAAKFVKRKPGTNSNIILDGSGPDEWLGFYDFSENPMVENPSRGVVLSSNNPPLTDSAHLFPGYYVPADRHVRINQFFHSKRIHGIKDMQQMSMDDINVLSVQQTQSMINKIPAVAKLRTQIHERCTEILDHWNGSHGLEDVAPVIYYKLLYHVLYNAFADELGEKDFKAILKTHAHKSSVNAFLKNDTSAWWDNVITEGVMESDTQIIRAAFDTTISQLMVQLGPNPEKWQWRKVHFLEIEHVIGRQKPFDKLFNIGPYPVTGGMETLNNQSFDLNDKGIYKVNLAPALRRTIDFADPENGFNVSPSGQSGNFMSRHYSDQTKLYVNGKVRKEMMNRQEIESSYINKITFLPHK